MMKLDEIAALAGVSRTTASYVINGKADQYRISQATRDKVMAVVHAHNYQPDSRAASCAAARPAPRLHPARPRKRQLRQARQAPGARGPHPGISVAHRLCSEDDPDTEKELARMLVSRHVDALLVASCLPGGSLLPGAAVRGVQILAIDRAMATEHFVTVASENQKASLDLTASLLTPAIGHIALITALPELTISQERKSGLQNRPLPVTVRPATCEGPTSRAPKGIA